VTGFSSQEDWDRAQASPLFQKAVANLVSSGSLWVSPAQITVQSVTADSQRSGVLVTFSVALMDVAAISEHSQELQQRLLGQIPRFNEVFLQKGTNERRYAMLRPLDKRFLSEMPAFFAVIKGQEASPDQHGDAVKMAFFTSLANCEGHANATTVVREFVLDVCYPFERQGLSSKVSIQPIVERNRTSYMYVATFWAGTFCEEGTSEGQSQFALRYDPDALFTACTRDHAFNAFVQVWKGSSDPDKFLTTQPDAPHLTCESGVCKPYAGEASTAVPSAAPAAAPTPAPTPTPTPTPIPGGEVVIPYGVMRASQSSTALDGKASRALTASPQTNWPGTCTHTEEEEQPWWKVSLQGTYSITHIELTNRLNSRPERLQGIDVYVDDTKCASGISVDAGVSKNVSCVGIGSSIKLQHPTRSILTLCGFRAWGTPVSGHADLNCTTSSAICVGLSPQAVLSAQCTAGSSDRDSSCVQALANAQKILTGQEMHFKGARGSENALKTYTIIFDFGKVYMANGLVLEGRSTGCTCSVGSSCCHNDNTFHVEFSADQMSWNKLPGSDIGLDLPLTLEDTKQMAVRFVRLVVLSQCDGCINDDYVSALSLTSCHLLGCNVTAGGAGG